MPANPEFAALLDSVECGVLLFNTQGELRAANDRLAEMLRIEPAVLHSLTAENFESRGSTLSGEFCRFRSDSRALAPPIPKR